MSLLKFAGSMLNRRRNNHDGEIIAVRHLWPPARPARRSPVRRLRGRLLGMRRGNRPWLATGFWSLASRWSPGRRLTSAIWRLERRPIPAPLACRGIERSVRRDPGRAGYAGHCRFGRADKSVTRPVISCIGFGSPVIALPVPGAIAPRRPILPEIEVLIPVVVGP
jgi:hypothetical protein